MIIDREWDELIKEQQDRKKRLESLIKKFVGGVALIGAAVLLTGFYEGDQVQVETVHKVQKGETLAFADGAYATGSDALLAPFSGDNISVHTGGGPVNEKIRSPLLTGIRGNLGKYLVRGTRAVAYILRRQHGAK